MEIETLVRRFTDLQHGAYIPDVVQGIWERIESDLRYIQDVYDREFGYDDQVVLGEFVTLAVSPRNLYREMTAFEVEAMRGNLSKVELRCLWAAEIMKRNKIRRIREEE